MRLTAILLAAGLAAATPAAATPILDPAQWAALIAGADRPFQPAGVGIQRLDQAGLADFPPLELGAGTIAGHFECRSDIFPCAGAYEYILTLPMAVVGFAADVHAAQGASPAHALDLWGVPVTMVRHGESTTFDGFVGALFAPTTEIAFIWPGGLLSTDDAVDFRFTDVRVLTAVPEPATAALLAAGLAALAARRRRRPAPPPLPRPRYLDALHKSWSGAVSNRGPGAVDTA